MQNLPRPRNDDSFGGWTTSYNKQFVIDTTKEYNMLFIIKNIKTIKVKKQKKTKKALSTSS